MLGAGPFIPVSLEVGVQPPGCTHSHAHATPRGAQPAQQLPRAEQASNAPELFLQVLLLLEQSLTLSQS